MFDKLSSPCTAATRAGQIAPAREDRAVEPRLTDRRVQALQRMAPALDACLRVAALETPPGHFDAPDRTGLGAGLKAGVEALSGFSMDHVRVYRNSPKPAQLQAHAYTQGGDIHLAPGQERHLPHEAWHVVQQMQGRVRATTQLHGVGINDDAGLEREADVMGVRAGRTATDGGPMAGQRRDGAAPPVAQLFVAQSHIQAIAANALDAGNINDYLDPIVLEFNAAIKLYARPGARKGDEYDAMMEARRAYFAAYLEKYAPGRDNDPPWQRLQALLPRWAEATNLASEKAAHDINREKFRAADAVCREGGLADREMHRNMLAAWSAYEAAYQQAVNDRRWDRLQPHSALLKTTLDIVGSRTADTAPDWADEYGNGREDSWADVGKALGALDAAAKESGLPDQRPATNRAQHPDIRTLGWKAIKDRLPSAQRALIEDIYLSWQFGRVLDKRDQAALANREKNSNEKGALRSWHMNEQFQLPNISRDAVPDNAAALHLHYTQHSRAPYDDKPAAGPIGYAEYTGTGIRNDSHNSKIVFDYKSGIVYVTVTHYALWSPPSSDGGPRRVGDKTAGSGTNSAWFAIDMTQ